MRAEAAGFGAQVFTFLYYQSWSNILASLIRTTLTLQKLMFMVACLYNYVYIAYIMFTILTYQIEPKSSLFTLLQDRTYK